MGMHVMFKSGFLLQTCLHVDRSSGVAVRVGRATRMHLGNVVHVTACARRTRVHKARRLASAMADGVVCFRPGISCLKEQ